MTEAYVKTVTEERVCRVTFFHPQSNSMPGFLLHKLAYEIEQAGKNNMVNVIILQSAGDRTFCAGASFDELLSIDNYSSAVDFFSRFASVINALRKSGKLVVGRIHGKVVGGGLGIVAACDYTIAHSTASIRLSELSVGIGPFVIAPVVERKIGKSAFSQMSIDTNWHAAEWAQSKGLFNLIFNDIQEMDDYINLFANELSAKSPQAQFEIKKLIWEGTDNWDILLAEKAEISAKLLLTDYTKKFLASYLKK